MDNKLFLCCIIRRATRMRGAPYMKSCASISLWRMWAVVVCIIWAAAVSVSVSVSVEAEAGTAGGTASSSGSPVPAAFIFGDSLADAGNNNHLRSLAKANHPPYGINYPGGVATGRFADGYNSIDYFAFKVGLPEVPIYANGSTKGTKLLHGVNFASAASGIMDYTGLNFGKVFSLETQVNQFVQVKDEIEGLIGQEAATSLISNSVFFIVSGSNDWLNTYFFPGSPLPKLYTVPQYRDLLIDELFSYVKDLYNLGARKIIIVGLGALGCSPSQLRAYKSPNGSCIAWLNDLCSDFNDHLRTQLFELAPSLPNVRFAFQNVFVALLEAANNPSLYGFTEPHQACCGIGKYGGFLNCFQGFPVCDDVLNHLYWDAYHPSSKFYKQLVEILWNRGPPYSYPKSGKDLLKETYE